MSFSFRSELNVGAGKPGSRGTSSRSTQFRFLFSLKKLIIAGGSAASEERVGCGEERQTGFGTRAEVNTDRGVSQAGHGKLESPVEWQMIRNLVYGAQEPYVAPPL